jgi:hypothetical protein
MVVGRPPEAGRRLGHLLLLRWLLRLRLLLGLRRGGCRALAGERDQQGCGEMESSH